MAVSFVDEVVLHLAAGDGGNGCVSVRREKFKPLAGPDGGNGGDGGSVILVADAGVTTLLGYHRRPHYKGENGGFGMGDNRSGASGENLILPVPVGTVVKDADGSVIADLDVSGIQLVVAEGGRGGLGNASLASPKRKAPGFALLGTPGWAGDVTLELKTMADVALVGFPSAGKSSFIAAVSAARPKIADYPFTTLTPNLGVVQAGDVRFTIADVPGLIEGASEGKGLGLEFLRHVERCSVLVHIIDCATLDPGRDPISDFDIIVNELSQYPVPDGQVPLLERPALVVLNKADVPEAKELAEFVAADFAERGLRTLIVSSVSRDGLQAALYAIAELVAKARAAQPEIVDTAPRIVVRPKVDDSRFTVTPTQQGDELVYWVRGAKPERWVAQTDFDNEEAVGYLADRLNRLGVEDQLFALGALAGSTVVIGGPDGFVFDWEPSIASAAELMVAPRGTDPRLDERQRPSRSQRRESYYERMDAKEAAREAMRAEGRAGLWSSDDDFAVDENATEGSAENSGQAMSGPAQTEATQTEAQTEATKTEE